MATHSEGEEVPTVRQSPIMTQDSFATLFTRPISGTIMVVALALLIWPPATLIYRRIRA